MTFFVHRAGWASTVGLLCCLAVGPSGTDCTCGSFLKLHFLCAGSVEREPTGVFVEGLVIPAVINLLLWTGGRKRKNDVEAERRMFAFVCHMSDVSTRTADWAFYGRWRVGWIFTFWLRDVVWDFVWRAWMIDWIRYRFLKKTPMISRRVSKFFFIVVH